MLILSGGHERFNCAGIQFNGAFRDSRFAGNSLSGTAVGAEELHNHFRLYYSQCSIGDTAAAAGFRQSVDRIPTEKYAAMAFLAAALGTAALVGFFSFLRDTVKMKRNLAARLMRICWEPCTMKKEEKQLHADHESGAELSLCGIPEAHCFPCARKTRPERGKSAAGDQCGGK